MHLGYLEVILVEELLAACTAFVHSTLIKITFNY